MSCISGFAIGASVQVSVPSGQHDSGKLAKVPFPMGASAKETGVTDN